MAVTESDDGFLLAEVPLGEGILDLEKVMATIKKASPAARFNLEMITRDPLRVPCLSKKYWATMSHVPGGDLAAMLALVRKKKSPKPLPTIANRSHLDQLRAEADNITRSIEFARKHF